MLDYKDVAKFYTSASPTLLNDTKTITKVFS